MRCQVQATDPISIHVRNTDVQSLGNMPAAQYAELCQAAQWIWETVVTVILCIHR